MLICHRGKNCAKKSVSKKDILDLTLAVKMRRVLCPAWFILAPCKWMSGKHWRECVQLFLRCPAWFMQAGTVHAGCKQNRQASNAHVRCSRSTGLRAPVARLE